MIYVAVGALALAALGGLLLAWTMVQKADGAHARFAAEREAWTAERRELLNRIQRPELIPHAPAAFEVPEQPSDEWDLVGTIRNDPEAYLKPEESPNGDIN